MWYKDKCRFFYLSLPNALTFIVKIGILSLAAILLSQQVEACAVCYDASETANRWAYYSITIFLSLLPLILFGLIIYWVYQQFLRKPL